MYINVTMKTFIRMSLVILILIVAAAAVKMSFPAPEEPTAAELLEPISGTWVMEWNDQGYIKAETHYLVQHSSNRVFAAPSEELKILRKVQFEILPGLDARRITLRVSNNNYGPAYGYYYPLSKAIEYHYGNTLIHGVKDEDSVIKWKLVIHSKE